MWCEKDQCAFNPDLMKPYRNEYSMRIRCEKAFSNILFVHSHIKYIRKLRPFKTLPSNVGGCNFGKFTDTGTLLLTPDCCENEVKVD